MLNGLHEVLMYLVASICCLCNEEALKAAVLAELCVQSLLVLPLLCQVADEQRHLQASRHCSAIVEANWPTFVQIAYIG